MASNEEIKSAEEFLRGQKDCQKGIKAKINQSNDYYRGYSAQYQHEQNMEHFTRGH